MKSPLIITATAAALLSGTALADYSSPSEFRGYQACLEANEGEFRGLIPERKYLINKTSDRTTYYINATAWDNGKRVDVAFTCDTSPNGRLVLEHNSAFTRYAAASDDIQVAGN